MDPDKLLGLLSTYEGFTRTLWNFYIGVILGLLAYSIGSTKALEWPVRVILAIAFSVFAWGNISFIERNQILINALSAELVTKITELKISTDLSNAISTWATMQPSSLKVLHLTIDVLVVILILLGPNIMKHFRSRALGG